MRKLSALLLVLLMLLSISFVTAQEVTEPPPDTTEIPVPPPDVTQPPEETVIPVPTDEVTVEPTSEVTDDGTMTATSTATATATATATSRPVVVPPTRAAPPFKADDRPRIAVISAFAPEIVELLAQASIEDKFAFNGVDFTTGRLAGNEVVMFLSGESIVNAAMNTQLVLDRFNVTHIIFSGIAGGVNPAYNIGDVVIAEQWGQYQENLAARELDDGSYAPPPWAATPFPNFNFMFPQNVNVRSASNSDGEDKFWFEVDPQMFTVASQIASSVALAKCTSTNVCLTTPPQVRVGGNGVSGPTFVDNAAYRDYAFATFDADALDMETASAAMVAYANDVPFIAFRSLSDLAGGGPGENEIGTFFQIAAYNSSATTIAFLNAWASQ